MPFLNDELVPRVDGRSFAAIESFAELVSRVFAPETLSRPTPVDLPRLLKDLEKPPFSIIVQPALQGELGERHAATDLEDDSKGRTYILVESRLYDAIEVGGPELNFARSTVFHELGHAFLHVHQLRVRRSQEIAAGLEDVLARARRDQIPAYEEPEWQSYAFAGCLAAPRVAVDALANTHSARQMAAVFMVSPAFMEKHLRRLTIGRRAKQ